MSGQGEQDPQAGRAVQLTDAERELLRRICERYRSTIPSYLKSKEEERATVEALIQKLS